MTLFHFRVPRLFCVGLAAKRGCRALHDLLFPVPDRRLVNTVSGCQFRQREFILNDFQSDLRFELSRVALACHVLYNSRCFSWSGLT